MKIRQVTLVYFSPTGTTRKVLEGIARGMNIGDVARVNLTPPDAAKETLSPLSDELVIFGAPVYGGRLPAEAVRRFRRLRARDALAVLVVVYGNREFDDALLELKDLTVELGFLPVAAGAFIGEHSFATEDRPIANGRPDRVDLQKAMGFGAEIRNRVEALPSRDVLADLEVPGRFPYEGGALSLAVVPVTDDRCNVCGECVSVCPTGAISVDGWVATKPELCIRCSACIKECPEDARSWEDDRMEEIATWLNENCSIRKEPQFFGID
jgi:ferredoxin